MIGSVRNLVAVLSVAFALFAAGMSVRRALAKTDSESDSSPGALWIARGLTAEASGQLKEAEDDLLTAARFDRRYLPAWTLANFYFRRGDPPRFWTWARRAADMSYGDLDPLLQLAEALAPGRASEALGDSQRLQAAYLDFLLRENRLETAQSVARKMIGRGPETPRLLGVVERQISAGNEVDAIEIWNGLARAGMIPYPPVDPLRPLTNGDLSISPTGQGFDWRLPAPGARSEWRESNLLFSFENAHLDACPLAEEFVPIDGQPARLRFEYTTSGLPSATGIHWSLDSIEGPPLPASESWREEQASFPASKAGLNRLTLFYRRVPGTTRAHGRIAIRRVRLEVS